MDFVNNYTVEPLDNSEVRVSGEIPFEVLAKERSAALKRLGQDLAIDGFRPGHIPEEIIEKHVGTMAVLSEMAERAMAKVYPEIITHHSLDAIGYPQITITKLAPDNPLGFTITVAVVPEVTVPDYKSLAKEINQTKESLEVTDEELQQQIEEVMRQKIAYERLQQKAAAKAAAETSPHTTGDTPELPTPESEARKAEAAAEDLDPATIELPELTDEFVQGLGQPGQFTTVDDFKEKLREHLSIEKERDVTAKHRAKLTDAIIEKTTVTLPRILIDSEIEQIEAHMREDLKRANLKLEDYLAHIKKTEAELKEEWKPAAEKRATLQLVLNEIAKRENITPDKKLVDGQVAQLKEQYKDADESRVRTYVASILQNEAVMKMLEEQT